MYYDISMHTTLTIYIYIYIISTLPNRPAQIELTGLNRTTKLLGDPWEVLCKCLLVIGSPIDNFPRASKQHFSGRLSYISANIRGKHTSYMPNAMVS